MKIRFYLPKILKTKGRKILKIILISIILKKTKSAEGAPLLFLQMLFNSSIV